MLCRTIVIDAPSLQQKKEVTQPKQQLVEETEQIVHDGNDWGETSLSLADIVVANILFPFILNCSGH